MTTSYGGGDLNQYYYPQGCNNGVGYYQSSAGNYLYRNSAGNWHVYSELNDGYAYIYCSADDILDCKNNMYYYSSGWYSDSSVNIYQCASGFVEDSQDDGCGDGYNSEICISNNGSTTKWVEIEVMCKEDNPVYYYEDIDENVTEYLHFSRVKKYLNSNVTYGKWIISADDIITGKEIAYCEQDDLLSCVEGEWNVFSTKN